MTNKSGKELTNKGRKELVLSFLNWLKDSDVGVDLCYMRQGYPLTLLKRSEWKEFIDLWLKDTAK
jgi:hypothetical protein